VLARLGLPAAPLVLRSPLARRIAFRDVMEHGERVDAADAVRIVPAATCSSLYTTGLSDMEFRPLPQAVHVPMWDVPEVIVRAIADWITSGTAAPTAPV
jgi:hypothetical protein